MDFLTAPNGRYRVMAVTPTVTLYARTRWVLRPGELARQRRTAAGVDAAQVSRRPVCRPEQVRTWSPPSRTRKLAARERPTSSTTRTTRPTGKPGGRSRTDARR